MPSNGWNTKNLLEDILGPLQNKLAELEKKVEDIGKYLGFEKYENINGLGKLKTTVESFGLYDKRIEALEKQEYLNAGEIRNTKQDIYELQVPYRPPPTAEEIEYLKEIGSSLVTPLGEKPSEPFSYEQIRLLDECGLVKKEPTDKEDADE